MKTTDTGIFTQELSSGLSFDMLLVEGGNFLMGGADEEAYESEKPIHQVNVSTFYLGKYPVTQELWEAVMGNNPSDYKGAKNPVENVSWEDAKGFIKQLNKETKQSYRLPNEAEWEFAARGGIHTEEYLYSGSDKLSEVGWYSENSGGQTQPVGQLLENELGLFDMSGNVLEWCEDDYHSNYQGAPIDGSAWIDQPKRGGYRVLRGGFWNENARYCRVSLRFHGLRPAIALTVSVFGWFSPEFRGWNPPSHELARPPGPCSGSKRSAAYKQGPGGGARR